MKKHIILAAASYTVFTFVIAVLWHVVFFKEQYLSFGYFEENPNFVLGFLSIIVQGFILSLFFFSLKTLMSRKINEYTYVLYMGIFFWTSHVLAFVAKQSFSGEVTFVMMETFYLVLQFGIFGLTLSLINKKFPDLNKEELEP